MDRHTRIHKLPRRRNARCSCLKLFHDAGDTDRQRAARLPWLPGTSQTSPVPAKPSRTNPGSEARKPFTAGLPAMLPVPSDNHDHPKLLCLSSRKVHPKIKRGSRGPDASVLVEAAWPDHLHSVESCQITFFNNGLAHGFM